MFAGMPASKKHQYFNNMSKPLQQRGESKKHQKTMHNFDLGSVAHKPDSETTVTTNKNNKQTKCKKQHTKTNKTYNIKKNGNTKKTKHQKTSKTKQTKKLPKPLKQHIKNKTQKKQK